MHSIDLTGNELPWDELGKLDALEELSVWDCGLGGSISSTALCGLTRLRVLALSDNQLHGQLPPCIQNLEISALWLDDNQISGPLSQYSDFGYWLKDVDSINLAANRWASLVPVEKEFLREVKHSIGIAEGHNWDFDHHYSVHRVENHQMPTVGRVVSTRFWSAGTAAKPFWTRLPFRFVAHPPTYLLHTELRLVGGGHEGLLQANVVGSGWGYVCADKFYGWTAEDICEAIGFVPPEEMYNQDYLDVRFHTVAVAADSKFVMPADGSAFSNCRSQECIVVDYGSCPTGEAVSLDCTDESIDTGEVATHVCRRSSGLLTGTLQGKDGKYAPEDHQSLTNSAASSVRSRTATTSARKLRARALAQAAAIGWGSLLTCISSYHTTR
eukprot:SAG22_NODE_215_length_14950_cov_4.960676_6_plen_384_part_00